MSKILLNKLILDISCDHAREKFLKERSGDIVSRVMIYSESMYPFADSLYITDTAEGFAHLTDKGYPTVALVHEENAEVDFGGAKYVIEQPELIALTDYDNIFRRLSRLPIDILETRRLYIRETTLDDLDIFYKLYDNPEVISFMEPLFAPEEEREYQLSYIDSVYGFYDIGMWTVLRKSDDSVIGRMGIEYTTDAGCVELGFMVGGEYRRQGYAYEACAAIIEYARSIEGIDRVCARVRHDNEASQSLCRKLNMKPVRELNDNLEEWEIFNG